MAGTSPTRFVATQGECRARPMSALGACGSRRLLAMCAVLLVVLACMFVPARAYADGYEMERVDMQAIVHRDGALDVRERRTFEFDGEVNGVYWTIPHAYNQQGTQSQVDVVRVCTSEDTGAFRQVDAAENGDTGVYTVDESDGATELKVFSPQDGSTVTFEVQYVLTGAVMGWSDTAELYWQFVGEDWDEASCDVELSVLFAGASLQHAEKGDLRAWGHGPLEGAVEVSDAGVRYTAPRVEPGEFAEARVAFPVAWVPELPLVGEERLPTILAEEQAWADEANATRERARTFQAAARIGLPVAAALFAAVVWGLRSKLKSATPAFGEEYYRETPSADHPAVIAAFYTWGKVGNEAFITTLMKLTDEGVIAAEEEPERGSGKRKRRKTSSYSLIRCDADDTEDVLVGERVGRETRSLGAIDRAALDLFFRGGRMRATFDSLRSYARKSSEKYKELLGAFEGAVSEQLAERRLIASRGTGARIAGIAVGAVLLIAGIAAALMLDDAIPCLLPLPFIALGVWGSCGFKRLTLEGAELRARLDALKRWFEEAAGVSEEIPGDAEAWSRMLVLAVALGVSDEVLECLAQAAPAEWCEEGSPYFPIWWWCMPHYGCRHAPMHALSSAYNASVSTATSSSDSSGAGFGGGFSSGGGGGVGGGGGGTF